METKVPSISVAELTDEQRNFLGRMMSLPAKKPREKIALYRENERGDYAFIRDAFIYLEHNRMFREAPPKGLWLTGATGVLRTRYGTLCISDERYGNFKPVPIGWAGPEDGPDLMTAMLRECLEELVIFSKDRKRQYVPRGVEAKLCAPCLKIDKLESAVEFGTFTPLRYNKKAGNVMTLHCEWDLRDLPPDTTIVSDDEWYQGGTFGAPVVAIDKRGRMTGYYSGQQGFVELCKYEPDEDLTVILSNQ